jgi:hypothetical protein
MSLLTGLTMINRHLYTIYDSNETTKQQQLTISTSTITQITSEKVFQFTFFAIIFRL